MNTTCFTGEFEFLPLRAQLDLAEVPTHPTSDDFCVAVSHLRGVENDAVANACGTITWSVAAARWRVEAIRERRSTPGAAIDTAPVFARVSAALIEWSRNQ